MLCLKQVGGWPSPSFTVRIGTCRTVLTQSQDDMVVADSIRRRQCKQTCTFASHKQLCFSLLLWFIPQESYQAGTLVDSEDGGIWHTLAHVRVITRYVMPSIARKQANILYLLESALLIHYISAMFVMPTKWRMLHESVYQNPLGAGRCGQCNLCKHELSL